MSTATQNLLLSVGAVQLTAADGESTKPATIKILAYSGGEMRPPGWSRVVVDLQGLEFDAQIPLLGDHDNRLQSIAGHGKPSIERGTLVVAGELVRGTPTADHIIALSRSGVTLGASIGLEPTRVEYVESGEIVSVNGKQFVAGNDGLRIVRASRLREVSFVAVGADRAAGVSSLRATRKGKIMPTDITATHDDHDTDGALEAAESRRIDQINAIAKRYSHIEVCDPDETGRPIKASTWRRRAIERNVHPAEFELHLMQAGLANGVNTERTPSIQVRVPLESTGDLGAQALSCAVARQFGVPERLEFAGRDYGFAAQWGEQVAELSDRADVRGLTSLHAMMTV